MRTKKDEKAIKFYNCSSKLYMVKFTREINIRTLLASRARPAMLY